MGIRLPLWNRGRNMCYADKEPFYHYVIVREDLPRGVALAQTVHAAGESAPPEGIHSGTHAVVLAASSEDHLKLIEENLLARQIACVAIREPDAPWDNALMSIGVFVKDKAARRRIRKVVGQLPLLR